MHPLLIFCSAAAILFTAFATKAGASQTVARAVEIPGIWQAEQHLYIKGNPGLPSARQEDLETWLDTNAPHWTIVLMEHASGESWQDQDGSSYHGMEAVEQVLGRKLPAETAFGEFVHPVTKEKSGAWLVIFLRERKFSYWAGDVYDRRRLGEDKWQGNLDSPARQAMRGGGRIADAVKDTITSIDGELNRRIAREVESRRQAEERQERLRARTASVIGEIRQSVAGASESAAQLRREWPDARGTLAQPTVAAWEDSLTEAAAALASGNVPEAAALVEKTGSAIDAWEKEMAAHRTAPETIRSLQQQIDAVQLHPWSGAARTALLDSRARLNEASAAHARAEEGFSRLLSEAGKLLVSAQTSDATLRRQVQEHGELTAAAEAASYPEHPEAAGMLEQARATLNQFPMEAEAGKDPVDLLSAARQSLTSARLTSQAAVRRAAARRQAVQGSGAAGALALLLGGWAGNRRRRPVKTKAITLFQQWEEALRQKTTELFSLLDRAGRAVGSADVLERSGWTGTTRELAQRTIKDVDQLFVMSSALDQVLEQARALIHPPHLHTRSRNAVSGANYRKAVHLLEAQQISFGPETLIPSILSTAPASQWKGLLGRREDCEPFTLSLSGLNEAFNERATRALAALDRVESAWTRASGSLTELETLIDSAATLEKQINAAAEEDDRFRALPVFEKLLPAARADASTASAMAVTDPVQAMEGPWAEGLRRAEAAAAICQAILGFRQESLPGIQQSSTALAAAGRQTAWITLDLDALSSAADSMAEESVNHSVHGPLDAWKSQAENVHRECLQAAALMERSARTTGPALASLEEKIKSERTRLAGILNLAPDRILTENGRNPSDGLQAATACHKAALSELDRGDPAAAAKSLDEAEAICRSSNQLVENTAMAWEAHPARLEKLYKESDRIGGLFPSHSALLDDMLRSWAPSALHPAAADPTFPDPGETVADNLRNARELLESARSRTSEGDAAARQGALLTAVDLHHEATADQAAAEKELAGIVRQKEALANAVPRNHSEASRLQRLHDELRQPIGEPATMRPTIDQFQDASVQLSHAISQAAATGQAADPFSAALALAAAGEALAAIGIRLQSDRAAFSEASRSLDQAAHELAAAEPLVRQASGDQIPDSPAMVQAQETLAGLHHALTAARQAQNTPHGDWPALDATADEITSRAANSRAQLKGELDRAAASLETIDAAARQVRAAAGWAGSMGITITGSPGRHDLDSARGALGGGDYEAARHFAESALRQARQAIEAAEAEQRRRRREQEQRQEAKRRAAAASSAFASRSRSSGSSGRSSSSSRSSFSSRSGASRSGW